MKNKSKINLKLINEIADGWKNHERIASAIECGANINSTEYGLSPLTMAIELQDIKLVSFLVENGAQLDLPDGEDVLPEEAARQTGNKKILKILGFI